MVILHIAVSVGWLGASLCLLVLGLTARLTKDPATANVGYRAMAILAGTLEVPVSLMSLLTGLVLAIGRPWGLTSHYWILAKLVLTLAAVPLAIFALPALIGQAVAAQSAGSPGLDVPTANNLVIAPSVAVTLYTAIVAISVLKPWGRIRRRRPNRSGALNRALDREHLPPLTDHLVNSFE
jgi:hypothetical protein